MEESNEGFGLCLGLGLPPQPAEAAGTNNGNSNNGGFESTRSFPLNLLHPGLPFMHQSFPGNFLSSSEERSGGGRGGGIDINQPAVTAAEWDENVMTAAAAVSSPHSTSSTVTGRRSERGEFEAAVAAEEITTSSMEDDDGGDAADAAAAAEARKKLRLSKEQAAVLEDTFKGHNTLNPKQKLALAKQLNLKPRQVEVWFQNRRARMKLKQTEIDCEYLRRCCERLADENRRLHKEVNDLRALKLSPQLYMNMSPPTTLIVCPQCQRHPHSSPPPTPPTSRRQQSSVQPPFIQWTALLQPQSHRPQL